MLFVNHLFTSVSSHVPSNEQIIIYSTLELVKSGNPLYTAMEIHNMMN